MTPDDLKECLAIQPGRSGAEFVSASDVLPAWKWLLRQRGFAGVVVESSSGNYIAACGAVIFVTSEWVDQELQTPRPGLNARLIAGVVQEGGKPIMTWDGVARANAEGKLDPVMLLGNWRTDLLTPTEASEAKMHLAVSFFELHRGYGINRLITEAVDSADLAYLGYHPAWKVVSTFEKWFAENPDTSFNRDRAIGLVSYQALFRHHRPALGLDDNAQTLLLSALRYTSDKEIARDLYISESAVRWRWARLFAHLENIRPDLVDPHTGSKRGAVKRSRILAYVRENPEELRPWKEAGQSRSAAAP
jgi:hypothetical protein